MPNQRRTHRGRSLAELARRQHGVVSARQLAQFGFAKATIAEAVRQGRLHRIYRGVYAVGHEALSWEGRLVAAILANEPAVASHRTAAWIQGLLRTRPGTFHSLHRPAGTERSSSSSTTRALSRTTTSSSTGSGDFAGARRG